MKFFSFELTMPSKGSWDGKWTGEGREYFAIRKYRDKDPRAIKLMALLNDKGDNNISRNFYYSWGDGWGANVRLELVNAITARDRQKRSAGFSGYEHWMINSILDKGKIVMKVHVDGKEVYEDEIPKAFSEMVGGNNVPV